jgi:hypothetical protein
VNYFYLVASLPTFAFGDPLPVSLEEFLSACRRDLSPGDAEELEAFAAGDSANARSAFARAWFRGDDELRAALVQQRAARLGVEAGPQLGERGGFNAYAIDAVEDAYAKPHPLEREMELDRFRWTLTEDLALGHYFDLTALLAYAAKMRINQRWQSLKDEAGARRLDAYLELVLKPET